MPRSLQVAYILPVYTAHRAHRAVDKYFFMHMSIISNVIPLLFNRILL